ncbi:MAG: ribonuclease E/G [Lachnospiraceae bacterium]|nr:ribonuclease E/G [Lachnospiraceae bacterium]
MERILTERNGYVLDCLFDNRRAVELRIDPIENESCIGNIYIGRVKDVVPSIGAAFVDIGLESNAFLPFSDLGGHTIFTKKPSKKEIAPDDEVLVMVSREPVKTKPANVTTKLSIPGKYSVVSYDRKNAISFSRKIFDNDWKKTVQEGCDMSADGISVIVRTNAYYADASVIYGEINTLIERLRGIIQGAQFKARTAKPVYEALPGWLCDIRDTNSQMLDAIITDSQNIYNRIRSLGDVLALNDKLKMYTQSYPLIKNYSVEKAVAETVHERVWLDSGAYLIIQPTEALTVIDVNSGKSERGRDNEAAYLKVNLEAAAEIARQLRLRNLSGIIVVDFINMKDPKNETELLCALKEMVKSDPVQVAIAGISNLGLVEITRKKVRKPITHAQTDLFFG